MGTLKGRNSSNTDWTTASAVYGYTAPNTPVYAKQMSVRNATNTGWERAWTDCRKYDAGGRDWSAPSTVVTYSGSCGNRTQTTTVTRTKTGCPDDVRATTVSSPDCNSGCFTATPVNCDGCGSRTDYIAKSGTNCTSYTVGSCGTWTEAFIFFTTVPVINGTYPYVSSGAFGNYYSDASGNTSYYNYSCGGIAAPGGLEYCSATDTYRVVGADTCIYPSCC